ncbi:MAG: acyl carrier protein [Candidatus Eremiobacteraeota bacterium]|nr:acyl carrier protein [Candidatus Eremiobacteraeota bacterium]
MSLTFNVPADTIADTTSQSDIPAWDSIGHANLILGLEEEFGGELPEEVMPNLRSFPAIVSYYESASA